MATGLRPDLIVRQVFRTAQPVVPASDLPAVLVGIQRQLEWRQLAGTYTGGQDNGDYEFPNLIEGSAVEPTTASDSVLQPHVFVSTEFGVADVTDDVTFTNLNSSTSTPMFSIASGAESTFEITTGSTGSFSSTTGKFIDPSADFIEQLISAGDIIKVNGVDAFEVSSLDSDDELTVSRISHGPSDAYVTLSDKDSLDVRILTYRGSVGGTNAFSGFITGGTKVGELVTFDGWTAKTTVGGMSFDATDTAELRDLAFTDALNALTSAVVGDVVCTSNTYGELTPAFIIRTRTDADTAVAVNLLSNLEATESAGTAGGSTSDHPARAFKIFNIFTVASAPLLTESTTGAASAATSGSRTFTDAVVGDFSALSVPVAAGDWIISYAAYAGTTGSTAIANGVSTSTITRVDSGSFVTDGFVAGQYVYVLNPTTSANKVVKRITTVTATVLTLDSVFDTAESVASLKIIAVNELAPLFAVDSVATTTLTVHDLTTGLIPTDALSNIRYLIVRATAVSSGVSGLASVSTQTDTGAASGTVVTDLTTGSRYLTWPVAFDSGTSPAVGDFVYSDDGVLLFDVVKKVIKLNMTCTFVASAHSLRCTSSTINWATEGLVVGDRVTLFGAVDTANNATLTITSITTTSTTSDTLIFANDTMADETGDTGVTLQSVFVRDHAQAGFALPADDIISGAGLIIRGQDQSAYSVVRVVSETQLNVRHVTSADQVTDAVISGMTTSITVPNTLTNVSYSIEKTLSGGDLTGDVLVTYAARRTDHLDELVEVTQATVTDVAGYAVPANPVGLAALNAVNNTGVPVLFVQVASDSESDWAAALNTIKTDQVYNVAPLTQTELRLAEFRSHIETQSSATMKRERLLWQSHRFETQETLKTLDTTDGESAVLTYYGSPLVQKIVVSTTSGIVALGVKAGGVVEGEWTGSIPGQGFVSGTISARIVSVLESGGTTTLSLLPDTAMPTTTSSGVTLTTLLVKSKVLSSTQLRDAIAAYPETIRNRRIRNIYPDRALITFTDETNPSDSTTGFYGGGTVTDYEIGGWLMAATAAAQRSGLPASTPLTKRPFSGIQKLVNPFTSDVSDLDVILDGGNYLLDQPGGTGSGVQAVHAISTDTTDLNYMEDVVATQLDKFARKLRRQVNPILGSTILNEAFYDLFSTIQAAVVKTTLDENEMKTLALIEIKEDETRSDQFLASYDAKPYYGANSGDITIYI